MICQVCQSPVHWKKSTHGGLPTTARLLTQKPVLRHIDGQETRNATFDLRSLPCHTISQQCKIHTSVLCIHLNSLLTILHSIPFLRLRLLLLYRRRLLFPIILRLHIRISQCPLPPQRLLRPRLPFPQAQHPQYALHALARLRAHTKPVLRARNVELDVLVAPHLRGVRVRCWVLCDGEWDLGHGVVCAQDFHGLGVAGGAVFCDDDVVVGLMALGEAR